MGEIEQRLRTIPIDVPLATEFAARRQQVRKLALRIALNEVTMRFLRYGVTASAPVIDGNINQWRFSVAGRRVRIGAEAPFAWHATSGELRGELTGGGEAPEHGGPVSAPLAVVITPLVWDRAQLAWFDPDGRPAVEAIAHGILDHLGL